MQIDFSTCSEEELWKFVAAHLRSKNIDSILVGGAVVSIYTDGAYESGDLDFILTDYFIKNLPEVMAEIGFKRKGRHYVHPDCHHLFVEFPKGPLEIGDDFNIIPEVVEVEGKPIKILSPTDCVKDRLASYTYFKSREGFDQAILVAQKHPVNLGSIEAWCKKEGAEATFREFSETLSRLK